MIAAVSQIQAAEFSSQVFAWGNNNDGQTSVPAGLTDIVAIASGAHTLVLRGNGTITAWGWNSWGQLNVPSRLNNIVHFGENNTFAAIFTAITPLETRPLAAWAKTYSGSGTDTFTAVLTAQPAADVVISVTSGDTCEARVRPHVLSAGRRFLIRPQIEFPQARDRKRIHG